MYDKYRKDAYAGEINTHNGSVRFAEDFDGDYYYFDVYDSVVNETKRFPLSCDEIFAIAKAGALIGLFEPNDLLREIEKTNSNMRRRQETMDQTRNTFEGLGSGGDGTPAEYKVEGWGIRPLEDGDFEVVLN